MNPSENNTEKPKLPESEDKTPDQLFVPGLVKKPQFQPPKFKYVPPKAGKRHF